ncbi:WD repeat-containing protein 49-like [Lampris incognitus]|uniref:WD repeat-containing protein 49-like n=1 Tax=Lampris incognitus TaxID=2546036 RepID=UPI0024B5CF10|nr:WD repeat-containing protein 49-like [Lampris incognitus]
MVSRMEVGELESRLDVEDCKKLKRLFLSTSGTPLSLSRTDFCNKALASIGCGSEEEYGLLFDNVVGIQDYGGLVLESVDMRREGRITWEGLRSFMILELSEKVEHPIASIPDWKPQHTLTCPHPDPIQQVSYLHSSGCYLTVSKRGAMGLRAGKDLFLLQTHQLHDALVTPRKVRVTDMVLLHNVHKIAVSFMSEEVCFYDLLSKPKFSCQYRLQGLKFPPRCLDYWEDPSHPDSSVLTMGDTGGQVSAICFSSAQISLFERTSPGVEPESSGVIKWEELVKGKHRCCYTLSHWAHKQDSVQRVRFLGSLQAFVSCSNSPHSSLVIGWREKERPLQVTSFHTQMGVEDLDYHHGLKQIATAGTDNQVLLWNPYVTSRPVSVLSGHTSPVTAVRFVLPKKQLLSFSKDKVLCLWDVSSELCVYRLSGVFPKTPGDACTLLFFHEEQQERLLLSFHNLLFLLDRKQERLTSHRHPVTCVLYNSLFRQVVSGDSSSSVVCWLAETGQRVSRFHRCHGDSAISAMSLDGMQTKLFTAGSDGEVKVWDFSGHCHYRLKAGQGHDVTISQLLLLRRSILVMGWQRVLTVFRLPSFTQVVVEPSKWNGGVQHQDNVLCAAFRPLETLVTGSCDGEIVVWNSSTEKALRTLRLHTQPKAHLDHPPTSLFGLKGEEDSRSCGVITRLFFIPGRTPAALPFGGADLVSCGGSGEVRFWNTFHSSLVGQFTAHNRDLGPIIMTISPCGKYLVTADMEGTLKTWDILEYCLQPDGGITREPPKLLCSLRPHLKGVMHLETCLHNDRLLLLSASADCNVALSYLPGDTVGVFGQQVPWKLNGLGPGDPEQDQEERKSDSGTFKGLQLEELQTVGQLSKPEFAVHPKVCFTSREGGQAETEKATEITTKQERRLKAKNSRVG